MSRKAVRRKYTIKMYARRRAAAYAAKSAVRILCPSILQRPIQRGFQAPGMPAGGSASAAKKEIGFAERACSACAARRPCRAVRLHRRGRASVAPLVQPGMGTNPFRLAGGRKCGLGKCAGSASSRQKFPSGERAAFPSRAHRPGRMPSGFCRGTEAARREIAAIVRVFIYNIL